MNFKGVGKRTLIALGAVTAMLLLSAGSCLENETHQDAPEPAPSNIINGTDTHVIQMPDGFRNVAFTCYDTTGIYVTSRGSSQVEYTQASGVFVVLNDPHCTAIPK